MYLCPARITEWFEVLFVVEILEGPRIIVFEGGLATCL